MESHTENHLQHGVQFIPPVFGRTIRQHSGHDTHCRKPELENYKGSFPWQKRMHALNFRPENPKGELAEQRYRSSFLAGGAVHKDYLLHRLPLLSCWQHKLSKELLGRQILGHLRQSTCLVLEERAGAPVTCSANKSLGTKPCCRPVSHSGPQPSRKHRSLFQRFYSLNIDRR